MRIALALEYDGSGFHGWQSQAGGGTVQDALESALGKVADHPVRVQCAGRTDAGVHATGQVVHFDTTAERPVTAWVRGVNAHLPKAAAVLGAQEVEASFHARFSATGRHYRYLLLNRPQRPAIAADRIGWYHRPLDEDAMRQAAAQVVGEFDFSAFRSAECQAKSPVRVLRRCNISRSGDLVVFDLHANGFLHHMIRNLVGSLIMVGNGRHPPQWLGDILAGCDRTRAAPTFPPSGLYLTGVDYDAAWNLKVGAGRTAPNPLQGLV
jgi:tRNA pseudouridine38-40 synthase